jgi:hypothetical protein
LHFHRLTRTHRFTTVLLPLLLFVPSAFAKPNARPVIGRRAVVIDERLSALRENPDLISGLIQRLRRGRVIGIVREVRTREGYRFYRVFVTRRTSGWLLAEALARSGSEADAQRLLQAISLEKDGFNKVRLASIFIREFGRTRSAPRGFLLLGESADSVASELTRNALRRLSQSQRTAKYLLNDPGLDRYNRIGVRFSCDGERLVYDGGAYRELLRRYPRSDEAEQARSRGLSARDTSQ